MSSKLSPYRKPPLSRKEIVHSPSPYQETAGRLAQKSRPSRSIIPEYSAKRNARDYQEEARPTEKKRRDNNLDLDSLSERNKYLNAQNSQLYQLLQERGRIISNLQQKLEEQVSREMRTLQQIEYEKNQFMKDYSKKIFEYETRIQGLIQEIYQLTAENHSKATDIDAYYQEEKKVQRRQLESLQDDMQELQHVKIRNVLEMKNHELVQTSAKFKVQIEQLKNQIVSLTSEIAHQSHMRKIQLSEQKIQHDQIIEVLKRQFAKEREILQAQGDKEIKKLQNLLLEKDKEARKLGEEIKYTQVDQNIRENQLIEKNHKLEQQLSKLDEYHRGTTFTEKMRLKELNQFEIEALEIGNTAQINNLKSQNNKLIALNNSKSEEVENLYKQIDILREQSINESNNLNQVITELRTRMLEQEQDRIEQQQRFKIKLAQLRDADLIALKGYYEHEIQVLSDELSEQVKATDEVKGKLFQQLQQKNLLRKEYDVECTKLRSRINELEQRLQAVNSEKREETGKATSQMQMTSMMLIRETKEKEKYSQMSEQEKKKLQRLIQAKDKQISDLNDKLQLLKDNHMKEIKDKNQEIDTKRKAKEDVDLELKKQKYFFENELKKRDANIKLTKENNEYQLDKLKRAGRQLYDSTVKELTNINTLLEGELNASKAREKQLREELAILKQDKQDTILEKDITQGEERSRAQKEKQNIQQNMRRYYEEQILKLKLEIAGLQRQLSVKEDDIRTWVEKHHKLQVKLMALGESQERLKFMQTKILKMGQQNNIVKDLAEIIKSRKRSS